MISLLLGEFTAALGGSLFGNVGQAVGLGLGNYIGKQLEHALFNDSSYHREGSRLHEVNIQTATYGRSIPIIYGSTRLAGNIIWASNIHETSSYTSHDLDPFGINEASFTSYSYQISLAIALGEGVIDEICKIWVNGKIIPLNQLNYRFYSGSEEQMPDPLLDKIFGPGRTPAYRGLSYVVFDNLPLAEYGNHIPRFSFEVKRKSLPSIDTGPKLEEKISAMVVIPGSGEFVYDTLIQKKQSARVINNHHINYGSQQRINQNNNSNCADAILSLDQLGQACPNIKWIAPVIGWFATSNNLKNCVIKPGIEFKYGATTSPDEWVVASYKRNSAHLISANEKGAPIYGGTTSDASFVRYLHELRRRGYKIMLYPMFFMDVKGKPWRGRLSGDANEITQFFNKSQGYKEFILHYANLVRGLVDVFIIGSELIGLTSVRNEQGDFPAITCLIELASDVRSILGGNVKISYAADWSEYHHTKGGYYNLDDLWSSPNIDFVAIDAYFPLTDLVGEEYDEKGIKQGWESGEGFDFYYDTARVKKPLAPEYAWKNIKFWWENYHQNPDGKVTSWQPKSKKIWFTELGFPSIDLSSNQPNIFYDPESSEGGFPRKSLGSIDIMAQRLCLNASLDKWQNSVMVENIFIWCWDARPFPFWPELDEIWADGMCWSRGHWLNGKLGICTLAQVVSDICSKIGLKQNEIDVSELVDLVEGYIVSHPISARRALENLQQTYFFDAIETRGKIKFIKRILRRPITVDNDDIIPYEAAHDNKVNIGFTRSSEDNLPTEIKLLYHDRSKDYDLSVASRVSSVGREVKTISIATNQVFSPEKARQIAETILTSFWQARNFYRFYLGVKYSLLKVGDLLQINHGEMVRITNICFREKRVLEISAVLEDISVYKQQIFSPMQNNQEIYKNPGATILHVLNLPKLPFESHIGPRLLIVASGEEENWRGALVTCPDGQIMRIRGSITGKVFAGKQPDSLIVSIVRGELFSLESDEYGTKNLALIGEEIIKFTKAKLISTHIYEISELKRGLFGTNQEEHLGVERFIILDKSLGTFARSDSYLGKELEFRAVSIGGLEVVKYSFLYPFIPKEKSFQTLAK